MAGTIKLKKKFYLKNMGVTPIFECKFALTVLMYKTGIALSFSENFVKILSLIRVNKDFLTVKVAIFLSSTVVFSTVISSITGRA